MPSLLPTHALHKLNLPLAPYPPYPSRTPTLPPPSPCHTSRLSGLCANSQMPGSAKARTLEGHPGTPTGTRWRPCLPCETQKGMPGLVINAHERYGACIPSCLGYGTRVRGRRRNEGVMTSPKLACHSRRKERRGKSPTNKVLMGSIGRDLILAKHFPHSIFFYNILLLLLLLFLLVSFFSFPFLLLSP